MAQWDRTRSANASLKTALPPAVAAVGMLAITLLAGCSKPDITAEHARLKVNYAVYNLFHTLLEQYSPDDKRRAALLDSEYAWMKQRETKCGSGKTLDANCAAREDKERLKELQVKTFLVLMRSGPAAAGGTQGKPALFANLPFAPVLAASSPQGDTLTVIGATGMAILDTVGGKQRLKEKLNQRYGRIEYSANGRVVMIAPGEQGKAPVRFYDTATGVKLLSVDPASTSAWLGGDGRFLAQVDPDAGNRLAIRDVTTGAVVGEVTGDSGPQSARISAIAVDADSRRLATFAGGVVTLYEIKRNADGAKPAVTLQSVAQNASEATNAKYRQATDIAFSRNGKQLYVLAGRNDAVLTYAVPTPGPPDVLDPGDGSGTIRPVVNLVPRRDKVVITADNSNRPQDYPRAFIVDLDAMRYAPLPKSAEVPFQGAFLAAPIGSTGMTAYLSGQEVWTAPSPPNDQYRPFSPGVLTGPKVNVEGDYQVQAIGVAKGLPAKGGGRITGDATIVEVHVRKTEKAQVLVLSSHKPVIWLVDAPAGNVRHILVSGQGGSRAFGLKHVKQTNIGRAWAYDRRGSGYRQLNAEVQRCLGRGIDNFQGEQSTGLFSVGDFVAEDDDTSIAATAARPEMNQNSSQEPMSGNPDALNRANEAGQKAPETVSDNMAVYKWTDASGKVHYGDRPPEQVRSQALALKLEPDAAPSVGRQDAPQTSFNRSGFHYEMVMTDALRNNQPVDKLSSIHITPQHNTVYFFTRLTGLQAANTDDSAIKVQIRVIDAADKVVFDATTSLDRSRQTEDAYVSAAVHPNTERDTPGNWTIQAIADGKSLFEEKREVEF